MDVIESARENRTKEPTRRKQQVQSELNGIGATNPFALFVFVLDFIVQLVVKCPDTNVLSPLN